MRNKYMVLGMALASAMDFVESECEGSGFLSVEQLGPNEVKICICDPNSEHFNEEGNVFVGSVRDGANFLLDASGVGGMTGGVMKGKEGLAFGFHEWDEEDA